MPLYCFTTEDGQTVEEFFPMSAIPEEIEVDGKKAVRDRGAEHNGGHRCGCWPMIPDMAFGFVPEQMAEVRANDREHGLSGTKYQRGADGCYVPIIESARHYKQYCQSQGMYHRNAGYSDAVPQNR